MFRKLLLLLAACTFPSGCGQPADYWAKLCEDRAAGKELKASGIAQVTHAAMVMPWEDAAIAPDLRDHPDCIFAAELDFSTDGDRKAFLKGWEAMGGSQSIIVSGHGEWKLVRRGDVGNFETLGLALSSVTIERPATTPELCKAFQCVTPEIMPDKKMGPG